MIQQERITSLNRPESRQGECVLYSGRFGI